MPQTIHSLNDIAHLLDAGRIVSFIAIDGTNCAFVPGPNESKDGIRFAEGLSVDGIVNFLKSGGKVANLPPSRAKASLDDVLASDSNVICSINPVDASVETHFVDLPVYRKRKDKIDVPDTSSELLSGISVEVHTPAISGNEAIWAIERLLDAAPELRNLTNESIGLNQMVKDVCDTAAKRFSAWLNSDDAREIRYQIVLDAAYEAAKDILEESREQEQER